MKGVPQLLLAGLWLLGLLLTLRDHDKPKTGRDSFWRALVAVMINTLILYWGGWFDQ
ncbi:MAG: hypothetical protein WCD76_16920 [Pyrinomonadaceae bacterium]